MFSNFIDALTLSLNEPLPGELAQNKMAPPIRLLQKKSQAVDTNPKLSAVLVLLYPVDDKVHTVLMLRNAYDGVHSGQISFPGGKSSDNDNSLETTALREAEEEIGIDRSEVSIIGKLTQLYIEPSRFLVYPFVGYLPSKPHFIPDKREVVDLIEMPLSFLVDENKVREKDIVLNNNRGTIFAPYFDVYDHVVWGATAMMLSELRDIIRPLI